MALHAVSSVEAGRSECSLPGETVEYPDQAECPPYSRVAAQRLPVEEQVQAYLLAGDQSGKDDEHGGACIVGELEEDYLGCYARGREVRECTRPWRAASAGMNARSVRSLCGYGMCCAPSWYGVCCAV